MPRLLALVILLGGMVAAAYAVRPRWFGAGEATRHAARPWRRVGAGICALLSIMFPVGLSVLDPHGSPRLCLAYWLVILLLVVWLMGLAFKDIRFTLSHDARAQRTSLRSDEQATNDETRR